MRPLIGISSDYSKKKTTVLGEYRRAVEVAGGVPVVIPQIEDRDVLGDLLAKLDGILITGGADIPPGAYGQEPHPETKLVSPERASFDAMLLGELKSKDIPVLGVCYGVQAINVAFGGTLHQHIPDDVAGAIEHRRIEGRDSLHDVTVERDSLLGGILGVDSLETNSTHHQSVRDVPTPLRAVAHSSDGVVEALESSAHRFLLGVQWHPERTIDQELHLKLFQALVSEASR